jgi:hypothetical protein
MLCDAAFADYPLGNRQRSYECASDGCFPAAD